MINLTYINRSGMQGHRDYEVSEKLFDVRVEAIDGYYNKIVILRGIRYEVKETYEQIQEILKEFWTKHYNI